MDLVITSCTSVAHMAAALGKETWILVPIMPYYTWAIDGDRSAWYDNVRLFRQTKYGDWSETMEQIKQALQNRVALKAAA
jgi:ADP-heptose:LPS heptosyltransferase